MTTRQFDKLAIELFGGVLAESGFTHSESKHCTFHRRVSEEMYHFVIPYSGRRQTQYDVRVFPSSPIVDTMFFSQFPDGVAIPTDSWCYLSTEGVGLTQQTFNCKSEVNFRNRFERTVGPLLTGVALPYLNGIVTVDAMIPLIKHPSLRGLALHHVGRIDEARPLLLDEIERLKELDDAEPSVAAMLRRMHACLHQ